MTLPASGTISLTNVMDDLRIVNPGRSYPISLGDADVLALAGKGSPPISLSDLYGKSSALPLTATGHGATGHGGSSTSNGSVSCSPYVTTGGGSGTITYLWEFTSNPSSCSLLNPTSAACTVSHSYVKNATGSASATLRCTVRDGAGGVAVADNVSADLSWDGTL